MAEWNQPDPPQNEPEPHPTLRYEPPVEPTPTLTHVSFPDGGEDSFLTRTGPPGYFPFPGLHDLENHYFPGYQLLGILGHGGLGVVFRARHRELGLEVALKVFHHSYLGFASDLATNDVHPDLIGDILPRLIRLRHPNLVATYSSGAQREYRFLVMELIEGRPLHEVFAGGRILDFRQAASLLEQLARGVACLHEQGILHRDIKPGNILIDAAGRPRLTDYGLATPWPSDAIDPELPVPIVGTPAFMAPEQVAGQGHQFGPPLDIWALGATFFWMLTGHHPFQRPQVAETLLAILHEAVPSPRSYRADVPEALVAICRRCLQRDPADRYPTSTALAADLCRFLSAEPEVARPRRPWWKFWHGD